MFQSKIQIKNRHSAITGANAHRSLLKTIAAFALAVAILSVMKRPVIADFFRSGATVNTTAPEDGISPPYSDGDSDYNASRRD